VFLGKTIHSHGASLHPGGGGVEILLAASCYGNRDKLRQYEPVWLIRLHFTNLGSANFVP